MRQRRTTQPGPAEVNLMDNIDPWVWILIAVVALLLVAALVWALTKGRKAKEEKRLEKEREQRVEAARLRDEAREASVTANQTAAGAAAARADADQARLDAERLERQAAELQQEAADTKQHVDHHLAKADEIDPDVTDGQRDADDQRGDRTDHDVAAARQDPVSEDRPVFTGKHGGEAAVDQRDSSITEPPPEEPDTRRA